MSPYLTLHGHWCAVSALPTDLKIDAQIIMMRHFRIPRRIVRQQDFACGIMNKQKSEPEPMATERDDHTRIDHTDVAKASLARRCGDRRSAD